MKKLAIVVFVATALVALPPRAPADPLPVAALQGEGLWGCMACVGSGVAMSAMGLGGYHNAFLAIRGGSLARACVSACTF